MNLFDKAIRKLKDVVQSYVDRRGITPWSERMDDIISWLETWREDIREEIMDRDRNIRRLKENLRRRDLLLKIFMVPERLFQSYRLEDLDYLYRYRKAHGKLIGFPDLFIDELIVDIMIIHMQQNDIINAIDTYKIGKEKIRQTLRRLYPEINKYFDQIDRGIEPKLVEISANANYYAGKLNPWQQN